MILSDIDIIERVALDTSNFNIKIEPFEATLIKLVNDKPVLSYGLSSYGYDLRLGTNFLVPKYQSKIIDVKTITEDAFETLITTEPIAIPANSFILGSSVEFIKVPKDLMGLCVGKSSYARCGLIVNTTPIEPEWAGHITLTLCNSTDCPIKVYPNEGIAQLIFHVGQTVCRTSYNDRLGKYQNQRVQPVTTKI